MASRPSLIPPTTSHPHSGDLARKKTFPSLLELFVGGQLPPRTRILGYARSVLAHDAFLASLKPFLKLGSEAQRTEFLSLCTYAAGGYDDHAAFSAALAGLAPAEAASSLSGRVNRLYYFAIPPAMFTVSAGTVAAVGWLPPTTGWCRVVVEKPFGHDAESSRELSTALAALFPETAIYRIDHYLGKEMVQNLLVLRFANTVFEPIWNRSCISNVQITFKEPFGVEGRGGYYNDVGIIRDVMQNHLLQVLSLVAMETPVSTSAEDIRDEKVKVLKCTSVLRPEDVVTGQYGPNAAGTCKGYGDDPTVPKGSRTPTFATAVLHINNPRWAGVPFVLKCGKALNERKAEIRIQFSRPVNGLFAGPAGGDTHRFGVGQGVASAEAAARHFTHNNELVIRIQPNEAVYLKMMSKMPGLESTPVETELNLSYNTRYPTRPPPEAYARLILDVLRGDQSQFVRSDELEAAWAIFTPLLHAIDAGQAAPPLIYPYGSRGPPASDKLVSRAGYVYEGGYGGAWRLQSEPASGAASLAAVRNEFTLTTPRLAAMADAFLSEMGAGLRGEPSSIKMIPSFVTGLPSGAETGCFWAVDMGGSNLRVLQVDLAGGGVMHITRELRVPIPAEVATGPGAALFDLVAASLREAGAGSGSVVGFTFSFPVAQTAVDEGTLIEWTKGFSAAGVQGKEVMGLLAEACARAGLSYQLVALVNDTVGTLLASAYRDPTSRIGVILGTGSNAAYCERTTRVSKWHGAPTASMVINCEWGGFGSTQPGGSPFSPLPFHDVDVGLDAESPNEGRQRYEKMISGAYLGELARRLLVQLANAGALSLQTPAARLLTKGSLTTEALAEMLADRSHDLAGVGVVLERDVDVRSPSPEARGVAHEVATLVCRRAARLAAMGVAAVATQIRLGVPPGEATPPITAGVDGSVFKKLPGFRGVRVGRGGGSTTHAAHPPHALPHPPIPPPTPPVDGGGLVRARVPGAPGGRGGRLRLRRGAGGQLVGAGGRGAGGACVGRAELFPGNSRGLRSVGGCRNFKVIPHLLPPPGCDGRPPPRTSPIHSGGETSLFPRFFRHLLRREAQQFHQLLLHHQGHPRLELRPRVRRVLVRQHDRGAGGHPREVVRHRFAPRRHALGGGGQRVRHGVAPQPPLPLPG